VPDLSDDIQRYLDRPLDELMQEFVLYREQVAGPMRGPLDAWEKLVPTLRDSTAPDRLRAAIDVFLRAGLLAQTDTG